MLAVVMFALLVTPASAGPRDATVDPLQYCATIKGLATSIMRRRQAGKSKAWMMNIANTVEGNVRDVTVRIVNATFLFPIERDATAKARITNDFANANELDCRYKLTGRR